MSIRAKLIKVKNILQFNRILSFAVIMIALCSYKPLNIHKAKIKTIVIDAGHGGHDAGSIYGGVREKDVALSITLKIGKAIEELIPDVKVVYTRDTDVFIELHERAGIANRKNADLFICVHCNANKNPEPFGSETYVMGLNKTEGNLNVAKRENSVILLEKDYKEQYEGFDPNSPEANIYFSFLQNAFLDQSLTLAAMVETEFKKNNRTSRGVKQAPFMVLWRSKMPSIYIETGFISNKQERAYLTSEAGQAEMASAVAKSVEQYKKQVENLK